MKMSGSIYKDQLRRKKRLEAIVTRETPYDEEGIAGLNIEVYDISESPAEHIKEWKSNGSRDDVEEIIKMDFGTVDKITWEDLKDRCEKCKSRMED